MWFHQCWPPELLCHLLASLLLPTPSGGGRPSYAERGRSRRDTFCGYCSRPGHPESDCREKKRDQRRSSSSGTPRSSSTPSLTDQDIMRLKHLLASSGSSSTDSAAAVTAATSPPPQASTQSGTSSWVLDSGASFHMSSDFSVLSSLRPLDSPVNVLLMAHLFLLLVVVFFSLHLFLFLVFHMILALP